MCLCVYESGERLHGLENTVDRKKWVAGGDSERVLVAEDSRQSAWDSIQDFAILAYILNFINYPAVNNDD